MKKHKLSDVADIRAGYQFRGRIEDTPGAHLGVLQIRNFDGDVPDFGSLVRVMPDRDFEPYMLRFGDVLFLSRGQRFFATEIKVSPGPVIAPNYFYIVRARPAVAAPGYLAWVLNQPATLAKLEPSVGRTNIPVVPKFAFDALEIEVPPLDVQHRIAHVSELAGREQRLLGELQQLRRRYIDAVCQQAAHNPIKNNRKLK